MRFRKIEPEYETCVFDGSKAAIEAVVEFMDGKVTIYNQGLVNAAPSVVVHLSSGSRSLATGDVIVRNCVNGETDWCSKDAFASDYRAKDED